ncbi:hypothetical protein [Haloprofundus salilacus]|uniref:hypothetical protein n=1 Tax=Haloprofundus salilacus TaxID=2876190 RepID=UPI001CCC3FBA|nr:hypothetical protein [Haloprofundus salilacus]
MCVTAKRLFTSKREFGYGRRHRTENEPDNEPDEHEGENCEGAETTGEIDDPPSEERSDSLIEQTMMDSDAETHDAAAVEPGESVGEDDENEGNEVGEGEGNESERRTSE